MSLLAELATVALNVVVDVLYGRDVIKKDSEAVQRVRAERERGDQGRHRVD